MSSPSKEELQAELAKLKKKLRKYKRKSPKARKRSPEALAKRKRVKAEKKLVKAEKKRVKAEKKRKRKSPKARKPSPKLRKRVAAKKRVKAEKKRKRKSPKARKRKREKKKSPKPRKRVKKPSPKLRKRKRERKRKVKRLVKNFPSNGKWCGKLWLPLVPQDVRVGLKRKGKAIDIVYKGHSFNSFLGLFKSYPNEVRCIKPKYARTSKKFTMRSVQLRTGKVVDWITTEKVPPPLETIVAAPVAKRVPPPVTKRVPSPVARIRPSPVVKRRPSPVVKRRPSPVKAPSPPKKEEKPEMAVSTEEKNKIDKFVQERFRGIETIERLKKKKKEEEDDFAQAEISEEISSERRDLYERIPDSGSSFLGNLSTPAGVFYFISRLKNHLKSVWKERWDVQIVRMFWSYVFKVVANDPARPDLDGVDKYMELPGYEDFLKIWFIIKKNKDDHVVKALLAMKKLEPELWKNIVTPPFSNRNYNSVYAEYFTKEDDKEYYEYYAGIELPKEGAAFPNFLVKFVQDVENNRLPAGGFYCFTTNPDDDCSKPPPKKEKPKFAFTGRGKGGKGLGKGKPKFAFDERGKGAKGLGKGGKDLGKGN